MGSLPSTRLTSPLAATAFIGAFGGFLAGFKAHHWVWFAVGLSLAGVALIADVMTRAYQASKEAATESGDHEPEPTEAQ